VLHACAPAQIWQNPLQHTWGLHRTGALWTQYWPFAFGRANSTHLGTTSTLCVVFQGAIAPFFGCQGAEFPFLAVRGL